jgi:hypothetical protein
VHIAHCRSVLTALDSQDEKDGPFQIEILDSQIQRLSSTAVYAPSPRTRWKNLCACNPGHGGYPA